MLGAARWPRWPRTTSSGCSPTRRSASSPTCWRASRSASALAATFHLLTHAAFKALLFLAAGSVIHAVGTNLMPDMGGLRRLMPVTFVTMTVGLAALAGLPPFAGFFSKEAVLGAAEETALHHDGPAAAWTGWLVLVVGSRDRRRHRGLRHPALAADVLRRAARPRSPRTSRRPRCAGRWSCSPSRRRCSARRAPAGWLPEWLAPVRPPPAAGRGPGRAARRPASRRRSRSCSPLGRRCRRVARSGGATRCRPVAGAAAGAAAAARARASTSTTSTTGLFVRPVRLATRVGPPDRRRGRARRRARRRPRRALAVRRDRAGPRAATSRRTSTGLLAGRAARSSPAWWCLT